jgi:hypothetical protein
MNANARFRVHSGCIRRAVVTGDGHSEDVRVLAEVTKLVNRSTILARVSVCLARFLSGLTSGQRADKLAPATIRRRACDTFQTGTWFDG